MKKPTVTIGIPAFNEDANIGKLLQSILNQTQRYYLLDEIIVVSDGSKDRTETIVKELAKRNSVIKLRSDGKNLGKPTRMNELYRSIESDIFINLDGDVILLRNNIIDNIAKEYSKKNIGIVSANLTALPPKNFTEKIIATWLDVWHLIRCHPKNLLSIHNYLASGSSMSRKLYKRIVLPKDILADDSYIYIKSKEFNLKFSFLIHTKVFYKAPATFNDYLNQSSRFLQASKQLEKYFGKKASRYFQTSLEVKVHALWKIFLKKPFLFIMAILFQIVIRTGKDYFFKNSGNGLWLRIQSSKYLPTN